MTSLARPNSITSSYRYDSANRLIELLHSDATGNTIERYGLTYTPEGEIKTITTQSSLPVVPGAKSAAEANSSNRIAQFGTATYSFWFVSGVPTSEKSKSSSLLKPIFA